MIARGQNRVGRAIMDASVCGNNANLAVGAEGSTRAVDTQDCLLEDRIFLNRASDCISKAKMATEQACLLDLIDDAMIAHIANFLPGRYKKHPKTTRDSPAKCARIRATCARLRRLIENPELPNAYITILEHIGRLNIEQIDEVCELIKLAQTRMHTERDRNAIVREIANNGFALRFTQFAPPRAQLQQYGELHLQYDIWVGSYDIDDQSDAEVDEPADEQEPWVDRLSFHPTLPADLKFEIDNDYEPYGWDRSGFARYRAKVPVSLFYIPCAIPQNVREFCVICDEYIEDYEIDPERAILAEDHEDCDYTCAVCETTESQATEWQRDHCVFVRRTLPQEAKK